MATRWGKLSPRTRDRYAAEGARYGLSRNAVSKRYNRGTYNPGSRKPDLKTPVIRSIPDPLNLPPGALEAEWSLSREDASNIIIGIFAEYQRPDGSVVRGDIDAIRKRVSNMRDPRDRGRLAKRAFLDPEFYRLEWSSQQMPTPAFIWYWKMNRKYVNAAWYH